MPVGSKPTAMTLLPQSVSQTPPEVLQPRQPTSLQGLLRFALEATKSEDAPRNSEFQPMDEERKHFLENALRSMTIDLVQILQKQIEIIKKVENVTAEDDVEKYLIAIDTVLEYVDNIDLANDFHKIGGFMTLYPCLKCSHPKIRAQGCELLAVLCQNNSYCQKIVLDNEFIAILLKLIETDEEKTVVTKSLYALGSIVRDCPEGLNQLMHHNGLSILLKTIQKNPDDKFIIKTAFLLSALCRQNADLKKHLISLGYLPCLISLILKERTKAHEHVLSLLVTLIEENPEAIVECQKSAYNLKEVIQKYIGIVRNREEMKEEEEYCRRLLHLLNTT